MSIKDINLVEQTFLSSLSNFEKALFGFTGNPRTFEVSSLLGVNAVIPEGEGDGVVFPAPDNFYSLQLSENLFSTLCIQILQYHFTLSISLTSLCFASDPYVFARVSSSKR